MKKFLAIGIFYVFVFLTENKLKAQVIINPDSLEVIESEDDEDVFEESQEFDTIIYTSSDLYWDFLRPRNFLFDTTFAPAREFYQLWDTIVINPYNVDLKSMEDTVKLILAGYDDCSFHPPAIGDITSDFGFRRWGRRLKFHYGSDIRMDVGDPVYAAFEGVVRVAKRSTDYGYVVLIRHNNGLETLYAHFSQLLVFPGQPVKGGDIIGLAGSTGRSTGPHLHFEVRFKGEKINPNSIIHFPTGSLLSDTFVIDKGCFKHLYDVKSAALKSKSVTPKYYTVKKGETLFSIARKFDINVNTLARRNKLTTKSKLKTRQKIRLR
ncbi:MAG: peptidoglycan DD-metalloendopeptidase family protein [Bacteroidia bacterium]